MQPPENLPVYQKTSLQTNHEQAPNPERLIETYLRTLTSPQTKKTYNTELRFFVSYSRERLGKELGEVNAEDLSVYREFLISSYSRATVAKKLAALRRFLTFTFMGGFTKVTPEAVKFFAKSPRVAQDSAYNVLTNDELSGMLSEARINNYRDYVMLALMARCGLREAEVVEIRVADFRSEDYGDSERIYLKVKGKGEKIRSVAVAPDLWELVQRFVMAGGKSFASRGDQRSPLFESREGNRKPLTTRSIRYIVKKYAEKSGITKEISPHSIRHTVGTNMAVNEAPLIVIQQFLGHSDPKTTMRYIRRAEQLAGKAYEYNTLDIT